MALAAVDGGGPSVVPSNIPNEGGQYNPTGTVTVPQAAPPPTPPQHVQTSAGYTPDYTALLQNDPGYQAALAASRSGDAAAAAQRQAALRQAVIGYGGLPQGFVDQYGDIDQATLDAAKNNQYSTLAGLQRNYAQSLEQFKRALAARGALQSGDLNYGEDQLTRGEGQQEYDAGNQFGTGVNGVLSDYLNGVVGRAQNLASAIGSAEQTEYNLPQNQPVNPTYADYASAESAQYGRPIYKDANGNLYDASGNAWDPSSLSQPAPPPTDEYPGYGPRRPGAQL